MTFAIQAHQDDTIELTSIPLSEQQAITINKPSTVLYFACFQPNHIVLHCSNQHFSKKKMKSFNQLIHLQNIFKQSRSSAQKQNTVTLLQRVVNDKILFQEIIDWNQAINNSNTFII